MPSRSTTALLSDSAPPRILLVDDESTGRRLLRRWIERGFDGHVVEANNGLEALEALAAEEFDLVVLDLMMPVLDGTETLSLIRSDPTHGDIEVVVASQLASEQKVKDVISLGVADYILKPLRYESVVERLHQVIERARIKKKEKETHSALPTVLVADADPNFCDFATSALSGRFRVIAARTAAETLVGVLKNDPELVLLSSTLSGLPFDMLGKKVFALTQNRRGKVCLLTDRRDNKLDEGFAGQVVRTFVPEAFSAEVTRQVTGGSGAPGEESWLKALEPEIASAVRQAMGMMTGVEPSFVDAHVGAESDMFGVIHLRAENGEFDLVVDLNCQRAFAVALCDMMLGGGADEADDDFLMSGLGEILNVVAGRIKNSCANRKIDLNLGLPELRGAPSAQPDAVYHWEQYFVWQDVHCFRLAVNAAKGTMPVEEQESKDQNAAEPSDASAPAADAGSQAARAESADPPSAEASNQQGGGSIAEAEKESTAEDPPGEGESPKEVKDEADSGTPETAADQPAKADESVKQTT